MFSQFISIQLCMWILKQVTSKSNYTISIFRQSFTKILFEKYFVIKESAHSYRTNQEFDIRHLTALIFHPHFWFVQCLDLPSPLLVCAVPFLCIFINSWHRISKQIFRSKTKSKQAASKIYWPENTLFFLFKIFFIWRQHIANANKNQLHIKSFSTFTPST